jgi:hypothetical protein
MCIDRKDVVGYTAITASVNVYGGQRAPKAASRSHWVHALYRHLLYRRLLGWSQVTRNPRHRE